MPYWLVKEEPRKYSYSAFQDDRSTDWTGVRNYQARNNLRSMQKGDAVIYYHTGKERQAVGTAEVSKTAFPDPTATEGDWSAVRLKAGKALPKPVELATVKRDSVLKECTLAKHSRLSVVPLSKSEYQRFLKLGGL